MVGILNVLGRVAARPIGLFLLTLELYHAGSVRADARTVTSATLGSLTQEAPTASERFDYDHVCPKNVPGASGVYLFLP